MNHRTEPRKRLQGRPYTELGFEFRVSVESFAFRVSSFELSKLSCPANSKLETRNSRRGSLRDTIALTPLREHVEGPRPRPTHRLRCIQKAAPHLSDAVVLQTCHTQLGLVFKNRRNLVTQERSHPFLER